ncbi:16S rRNA (guanine(527)-N(7))-methyltransferase RsmG [Ideonella sp. 4Y16]|uniref:16S rRNA (guanine(527)-N(7))-methyltransferase RsmG n=1 Tax=Ideonella alba TaxID=2824118 RepID=UPI001B3661B2|nr:16S rRNA (guanine(527)-N(7))-methyltransferase RsmG [Ideonella alba]MBQ0945680.1 16S rRNA (guanine(527)-N(7))-methyltransferase RsmG [Ideonella alba]
MSHPHAAALARGITALGLTLPDGAEAQLLAYLDLIARWNQVYNLTAVRDPAQMLTQHLLDCLAVVQPLRQQAAALGHADDLRLLDVGSGAGLPGVVLAIANPGWSVTCVDTVAKKATFIRQVGAELGLRQLQAVHQRVEAMSSAPYTMITSRAFASLVDFITLTRGRLAPGGCWAAMKARLTEDERQAVPTDVSMFHVERLTVPGLDAERCIVWLRPAH